jgi:hypothetical protein
MNPEIIAPGIYIYNDVGLSKNFDSLMSFVNQDIISWEDTDLNSNVQSINIAPDEKNLILQKIYKEFEYKFNIYEKQYLENFNTPKKAADFSKREFIFFLKYLDGASSPSHFDDLADYTIRVTLLYYPNDNYDGGEIVFPKFNVKFKPKSDQIILFPSSYVYEHYVCETSNGTRYAGGTFLY